MTDIVTIAIDDTFKILGPSMHQGTLFPAGEYIVQCDLDIEVTQATNRDEPWSDDDKFEIIEVRSWTAGGGSWPEMDVVHLTRENGEGSDPWDQIVERIDFEQKPTDETVVRWLCEDLDLDKRTAGRF